jgi:hypothetical protein
MAGSMTVLAMVTHEVRVGHRASCRAAGPLVTDGDPAALLTDTPQKN